MNQPIAIVAYLALFAGMGFLFLLGPLLLGMFLRPKLPNTEKLEIYECGEPTIGSSFVQFDLRFYVVALLFIIFDVEVAFFFPWATVFGKAVQLAHLPADRQVVQAAADPPVLAPVAAELFQELGVDKLQVLARATQADKAKENQPASGDQPAEQGNGAQAVADLGHKVALISMADIAVFFAVLLVGFAYVWKRGDLDWVRAIDPQESQPLAEKETVEREPLLSR